ncbi:MAG: hypothetical protein HY049_06655 [Acidobacteria bacterium]|nr:hypothetical protein [Acidobacteriota bacterium]
MSATGSLPRVRVHHSHWNRPKSRRWFLAFLGAAGATVLTWLLAGWSGRLTPSRGAGLAFGVVSAALLVACMALSARKRFKERPLGATKHWLQFHMYGGTLCLLFFFMHTGFSLPSGLQTWLLFTLMIFVSLSGLAGTWLQKWIPHALARGLQVEAIYERIPELVDRLRAEAEEIVKGGSQTLVDFHRSELAPSLARPQPGFGFLFDATGGRIGQMIVFTHVAARLPAPEKEKLTDLRQILLEKNNLDAQLSLQRILRIWLYLHVPASALLLALVLAHVGAWIYY